MCKYDKPVINFLLMCHINVYLLAATSLASKHTGFINNNRKAAIIHVKLGVLSVYKKKTQMTKNTKDLQERSLNNTHFTKVTGKQSCSP